MDDHFAHHLQVRRQEYGRELRDRDPYRCAARWVIRVFAREGGAYKEHAYQLRSSTGGCVGVRMT